MKSFKIPKKPYSPKWQLYKTDTFNFEPGVTVLVGCNGSGKSTALQHIKSQLDNEDAVVVSFDNVRDGGSRSASKALFAQDVVRAATIMSSSEGERIVENLIALTRSIKQASEASRRTKQPLYILLDAVDSGLSVDNVIDIKECIFQPLMTLYQNEGLEAYIICAANEYELCRGERCMDVRTGKEIRFKTYEGYRKFIIKSRKYKDKTTVRE